MAIFLGRVEETDGNENKETTKVIRPTSEKVILPTFLRKDAYSEDDVLEEGERVVITFGGREIRELKDLREAFRDKDKLEMIQECLDEGILYCWLVQHYYEDEAEAIHHVSSDQRDWLKKVTKALKVPYNPLTNEVHQEGEEYEKRKAAVREAAETDENLVPDNANLVALDQEELSRLLDVGEKQIYLCKGTFAIPLSVSGVHYMGINHPVIENAFTEEQYQKAGIQVENIDLPDSVDEDRSEYALKKAMDNGYDVFYEQHSSLTNAVHKALYNTQYYRYYVLPTEDLSVFEEYSTEGDAKKAAAECIRKTYDAGSEMFDAHSEKCLMKDVVLYYGNVLQKYFGSFKNELENYCSSVGKQDVYEKIKDLAGNCKTFMQKALTRELEENRDYYEMYKFDYFVDQVKINEFDSSVGDTDIVISILETFFINTKTYTVSDIFTPQQEMEKDVNNRANSIHRVAKKCFGELVSDIESSMELLGRKLEPMEEEESIQAYLERMTKQDS